MTLRHAEQWMDDQLQNWIAGKSESPELVRHVDFSAKELRKVQANALRFAAQIAYDGCQGDKEIHNLLLHEANQLDPQAENQNEQHPE